MKELFRMTRSERIGTLLLIVCLTAVMVIRKQLPPAHAEELFLVDSASVADFDRFCRELEREKRSTRPSRAERADSLFLFDPNTIDSLSLRLLGVPAFVAGNLLKYREKGGRFRSAEAFSKLYGLERSKYELLKDYIAIDTTIFEKHKPEASKRDSLPSRKFQTPVPIALDKADTALLRKIPGIGAGYAQAIVRYREALGGFYAAEQVQEITLIPDSLKEQLMTWFFIEEPELRPIKVNRASVERLRNHPYLNFYQAKAIVELKKKRGKLHSIKELSLLEEFSAEDLERLVRYLDFSAD